jgi:DNA-binding beta-propeller fold protein YncE
VYVADAVKGTIYSFDRSGNYTGMLVPEKTFSRPEALRLSDDHIIVSDGNRICSVDVATGAVFENGRTGSAPSRIVCAQPDVNGNILATDFVANEVYVLSKMTELVGGLFVQIERINADKFPNVTVEIKVENRQRQPVVGLKAENFYMTENGIPVTAQKLEGSAYSNDVCDIVVVLDRSVQTSQYNEALETALKEIANSMEGKGTLTVVSSGSVPTTEYSGAPNNLGDFTVQALKTPVAADCTTDLALRLAGNTLVNGEKKRSIIYLTGASSLTHSSFLTYGLSDMVSYFNNNGISFYTVNLTQNVLPEEIIYMTEATDGDTLFVYRPEGLFGIVKDVIATPNGSYRLSYTSSLNTNFGKEYLPLEVEAYLLNRSGRDEIGYYAPLE